MDYVFLPSADFFYVFISSFKVCVTVEYFAQLGL